MNLTKKLSRPAKQALPDTARHDSSRSSQMAVDQRILNRRARMGLPAPATSEVTTIPSTRDFQEKLIAIRADRTKTTVQRQQAEAELIARRRRQRGE